MSPSTLSLRQSARELHLYKAVKKTTFYLFCSNNHTFTISISHLFFIVYFAGVLGFCLIFSFLCSLQSQFLPQYCQKLINVHTYSYSHVCSRYFWCEWVFKWECICVCILCVVACKVFCQLFQNLRDFLPVQWDS